MSSAANDVPVVRGRQVGPPAEAPCRSCPYRRDVPPGVWDITEYEKLPRYDRATGDQPTGVFQCHLTDNDTRAAVHRPQGGAGNGVTRICAGWAGCHDGDNLLSLRMAVLAGHISPDTAHRTVIYESPVPLWDTGATAAAHGVGAILNPPEEARRIIDKLVRVYGKTAATATAAESVGSTPEQRPGHMPHPAAEYESATVAPVSVYRVARAIHRFLVDSAGFDAGQPMFEQAAELADRLADAGLLTRDTVPPPGRDATSVIRKFIVDSSGEDLGSLTTDQAEQLRATLASGGLLGDGVFTPVALTAPRDDWSRSS